MLTWIKHSAMSKPYWWLFLQYCSSTMVLLKIFFFYQWPVLNWKLYSVFIIVIIINIIIYKIIHFIKRYIHKVCIDTVLQYWHRHAYSFLKLLPALWSYFYTCMCSMFPTPCLTVAVFFGSHSSFLILQTWWVELIPYSIWPQHLLPSLLWII